MTKTKTLLLLTLLSSLVVYLEWGGNNSQFLAEIEMEFFSKLFVNPLDLMHPFTVLPLIGQILLVLSLAQKQPDKRLVYFGIGGIAVLVLFVLFIGILNANPKIILSTLPFLILGFLSVRSVNKEATQEE